MSQPVSFNHLGISVADIDKAHRVLSRCLRLETLIRPDASQADTA